ncbi:DUF4255 domain-containing protein [Candidatus Nitrotoga sp. M5]|uniref:DUF4255 domain-containing protein n=1 Tax=Candidatus Nitrotoga sp. M5 TaxID=2890409 RepID=UPI001EF5587A|nr:DUF4255 domain-containing protein [Candidatus Nitrotoga sp. M5]CAH1388051.1 conserved hypothetical protein [Candidatus Nitrotoga sp. M5]
MSSALAIAGVTAVLRDLLNDGLINHDATSVLGATVSVSAGPPDRVIPANSGTESSQLNLFMYHVTPNTGWRNESFPTLDATGSQRLSNAPLALNLHYLLSAHGSEDLHGEILLGYAMQLLHEMPILSRKAIRKALDPSPPIAGTALPAALKALADSGLEKQIELIKITPEYLNTEELSKLWTSTQSHLRPTAAYMASVVLIESTQSVRSAPPVLTRGPVVKPDPLNVDTWYESGITAVAGLTPPYPILTGIELPDKQIAARLGETIKLKGYNLNGTNLAVRFAHPGLTTPIEISLGTNANEEIFSMVLPNTAQDDIDWPAGIWEVTAILQRSGETVTRSTNPLTLFLAPRIDIAGSSAIRDSSGVTITLVFAPQARPGQRISLNAGGYEASPEKFTVPTASLQFKYAQLPAGSHLLRLRVDGADSLLVVRLTTPPQFDNTQMLIVP